MHVRVLFDGKDVGGATTITGRLALTARHVVANKHKSRLKLLTDDGEYSIAACFPSSLDVCALLTEEELPDPTDLIRAAGGSEWSMGRLRNDRDTSPHGPIVAWGRDYATDETRSVRVIELECSLPPDSLDGYSGTGAILADGGGGCFGIVIEAEHFTWLKTITGQRVPTGKLFAIDIFDAVLALPKDRRLIIEIEKIDPTLRGVLARLSKQRSPEPYPIHTERKPYVSHRAGVETFLQRAPWVVQLSKVLKARDKSIEREFDVSFEDLQLQISNREDPRSIRRALDECLRRINSKAAGGGGRRKPRRLSDRQHDLVEKLRSLHSATQDTIFLVVGPFGSGKSRLIQSAAEYCDENKLPHFELRLDSQHPLEVLFLEAIRERLNIRASGLRELGEVLNDVKVTILVTVDDVDAPLRRQPGRLAEFTDFLAKSASIPYLKWIVTADELYLDSIQSQPAQIFWGNYGAEECRRGGGWVDLDMLNRKHWTGYKILEIAQPQLKVDLELLRNDEPEFEGGLDLNNPLVAWIRAEASHPELATSLNRADFIETYWSSAKAFTMERGGGGQANPTVDVLEVVVQAIAKAFRESYGRPVHWTVAHKFASADETWASIRLLESLGLLHVQIDVAGDPNLVPLFDPFWAYRIALPIAVQAIKDPMERAWSEAVKEWVQRAGKNTLAESVASFIYLFSRSDWKFQCSAAIWRQWSNDRASSAAALFDAALPATPATRAAVAQRSKVLLRKSAARREIFMLLRFWKLCDDKAWSTADRLLLVQPWYHAIGNLGLGLYFEGALRELLTDRIGGGRKSYSQILNHLIGVEDAGALDVAVDLAIRRGVAWFDTPDSWLASMEKCFAGGSFLSCNWEVDQRKSPPPTFGRKFVSRWTDSMCDRFGLDAFSKALKGARFASESPKGRDMREYLLRSWVMSAGQHVYYMGGDAERRAYLQVVGELTRGTFMRADKVVQRRIAFFMIRHSRPTRGQANIQVDQEFHSVLRRLAADDKLLSRLGKWGPPLFEANGVSVRSLRRGDYVKSGRPRQPYR